ncbi:MAG: hypothetical protein R3A47_04400 [Polyangiales bacterium]
MDIMACSCSRVLEGNQQVAISDAISAQEIARFNVGHAQKRLSLSSDNGCALTLCQTAV